MFPPSSRKQRGIKDYNFCQRLNPNFYSCAFFFFLPTPIHPFGPLFVLVQNFIGQSFERNTFICQLCGCLGLGSIEKPWIIRKASAEQCWELPLYIFLYASNFDSVLKAEVESSSKTKKRKTRGGKVICR